MFLEPALPLFVQGHERHSALDDLLAVAKEEVKEEEHQEEPDQGSESAEKHELGVGERELERRAQAVDDPRLDLVHGHRRVVGEPVNDPVHDRNPDDVARSRDPVAVREGAEPLGEIGRLAGEGDRDEGGRYHDCQRDNHRHQQGGRAAALLPIETPAESGVHGIKEKRQKEGPENRSEERLQDQVKSDGKKRRHDEAEHPG